MSNKLFAAIATLTLVTAASAQWPMFHGSAQRTGQSAAVGPQNASILWSYDLNGPMINSPVIGPDGTIYTGSVWDEDPKPSAYVYALNPSGTLKWRFETGFFDDQSVASPAVGPEGNVYVGTAKNIFYALNSDGQEIWRYTTLDQIVTHPVIAPNGTVYAKLDGFLVAFSPTGQVHWQFPVGSNTPGSPSLASDGTIYVPGDGGLFAINPNGTQKWKFVSQDSWSSPAVASDGKIIYASGNLYAINPNGTQAWQQFGFGIAPYSAPTIDAQGNIYLIEDWELRKHSPTGQVIWTQTFLYEVNRLEQSWNAPILDSANRLYFALGTGKRYALDSAKGLVCYNTNGTKLYNLLLPETPSTSSPAMGADGTIYIGCLDGQLYAIGQPWQVTNPNQLTVQPGTVVSGGLPQLLQPDDQYLEVRPGAVFSTAQRPIVVTLTGTVTAPTVTTMQAVIESRTTSANIRQWVEAWNFTTSAWVEVDARQTSTTDTRVTVQIPNATQFVEEGTKNVRFRVSYRAEGPVFSYPWTVRIDQAVWNTR